MVDGGTRIRDKLWLQSLIYDCCEEIYFVQWNNYPNLQRIALCFIWMNEVKVCIRSDTTILAIMISKHFRHKVKHSSGVIISERAKHIGGDGWETVASLGPVGPKLERQEANLCRHNHHQYHPYCIIIIITTELWRRNHHQYYPFCLIITKALIQSKSSSLYILMAS